MANFNKAFNFRGGFQVDTDVFIVRGQNVGIGSTIPNERLVVDGKIQAKSVGVDSISIERSQAGILTVTDRLDIGIESGSTEPYPLGSPQVRITTGIITAANPAIGFVTYYGDGGNLLNLPTSQWVDTDVGLGFTSIYAAGNVGVGTTDPRFTFQVGATPVSGLSGFNSSPGVGIDSGSIWATNDIRIGGGLEIEGGITIDGDVSIGSTLYVAGIVSAQEFAGIGSLITSIDADNITIGSISSDRYGDLIVTKEVIADRFIGTATSSEDLDSDAQISIDTIVANTVTANSFIGTATSAEDLDPDAQISIDTVEANTVTANSFIGTATSAEDLVPGAQISIDSVEANTIDAIDRFTTINGNIAVGHTDIGTIGDIDVRKTSSDSTIYSLTSTDSSARIFVGHQREESSNTSFGGLRFGGNISGSPISGPNDLDIVNYDVGNLNYYLHDGSSGGTVGNFRWINGQLDIVLMELTNGGGLVLAGNEDITKPTLEVTTGFSTFKGAATFDSTVDVVGNATFSGDVSVDGELTFGSILINTTFEVPSLIASNDIIVGANPSLGGVGVRIESGGSITASNSLNIGSSVITNSGVTATNLTANSSTISGTLTADTLIVDSISTPGASISDNGNATFNDVTVNGLIASSLSVPSVNIQTIITDSITAVTANATNINSTDILTDTVTAASMSSSLATISTLQSNSISPVSGPTVTISNLTSSTGSITNLNSTTANFNSATTNGLNVTGTFDANVVDANFFSSDNAQSLIDFNVDIVNRELIINVYAAGPSLVGTITLPYVPTPE